MGINRIDKLEQEVKELRALVDKIIVLVQNQDKPKRAYVEPKKNGYSEPY